MGILERLKGQEKGNVAEELSKGGFSKPAHVSIAGNRFTLVNDLGDELPWPQLALDVVIVEASKFSIRSYYDPSKPYDPNIKDEAPLCASQDGVTPDDGVRMQQSDYCSRCEMNKFGSDPRGRGGKACQEYKRLAITVIGDTNPHMAYLFGVSSGSHKNLRDYAAYVRRLPNSPDMDQIITRVEFESQGVLKFTPIGWVDGALRQRLIETAETGRYDMVLAVTKQGVAAPALAAPQDKAVAQLREAHFQAQSAPQSFAQAPHEVKFREGMSGVEMTATQYTPGFMQEALGAAVKEEPKRRGRKPKEEPAPGRTAPAPMQGGFQPSPSNPFAGFGQNAGQQQPTFGIQEQPDGLTDEMEAALAKFMESGA
jgi:hypothetical protein